MRYHRSIWLITGASSGLGRAIAQAVLEAGDIVIATARDPATIRELVERFPDQVVAARLDVTDRTTIAQVVGEAERRFGRIDVLVNAAGYGYLAAIEEGEDSGIRAQFETNVFGLLDVTKAVLPGMRARRRGCIVNLSSLGGLVAFAATGYYHATKFAIEALSESLSHEVGPLGIKVLIVEPGAFRTDWAGRSMIESPVIIDDYAETAGKRRTATRAVSGSQPGDPKKAAQAILNAVKAEQTPLRLLLGASALKVARARMETLKAEFEALAEVTTSVDFESR
ncbi:MULTISPECIES: oxidoreductase [unclassified Rhizobium]|uniref:oxidoreductase n=1 Tax=unclassified Rhizobium TaxID=2613769 RepID=UPI00160B2C07|nr:MULTISPECIES: oxidoreductase [unclassified Rhizobium]MBB3287001.1 NAD(P)-dependent dehydrogenase (short-subunit alcohol dehydrogenase family) [Rhizobium sp. BK252]MBB3401741.1 NAD(P)-dependent dehydrogenase (short-subunit alcohol dehydrogenase family) [Rhizobium sp. BK289]MBB3414315.1 NAD(P)-dependent dehydrogenase (short-subunit alcohol dehydrogenase family) [Rhizobium sp. BK284]MBB3482203.1 NAD(P)-dependent dehydrogenase (short-subunit alcohol dehydrogenase family) [Rhizobium sp. BK347]